MNNLNSIDCLKFCAVLEVI